jgi:hypothetical protein
MTSPGGRAPHSVVLVAEPMRAHPQRIPGSSHEKPVLAWGRAIFPVQVALLAAVYLGAALHFGQPAASLMTFVASGVAIWGTVGGYIRTIGVAEEKISLRACASPPFSLLPLGG